MSSSAAAVRRQADTFPLPPDGRGTRAGLAHGSTAFPFSLPVPAGGGADSSDREESGSNASDSALEVENYTGSLHAASTARDPGRSVAGASHSAWSRRDPSPLRKVNTTTSDSLEVQPANHTRSVSPSPALSRPRSGKLRPVASSPRKISLEASAATFPGFMDLFIQRDSYHHDFGFDITGGCDTGHPLIVSGVLLGGPADAAGLCPDDVLLAVDGIKASNLSHVDTVQIIKTALQIHLKVERVASAETRRVDGEPTDVTASEKAPQNRRRRQASDTGVDSGRQTVPSQAHSSRGKNKQANTREENDGTSSIAATELNNQAYAWIDIAQQPCSPPPEEDTLSIDGSTNILPERKCVLLVSDDVHLGLLIRGGLEYGLGIYVTGLDKASAAEAADLRVGDQILSVNNCDFGRISHTKAVRILRTHRHMTLRVRHVGRLPYARRLTASSLSSSSSIQNAQENLQSLFTDAALLTDPAEEEIDRLTREAMLEQIPGEDFYESGVESLPYESNYLFELELDEAVVKLKEKIKEKRQNRQNRPRAGRLRSTNIEYWLGVVQSNAEILLKDDAEKEALMYFLREYVTGALGVDALVLSLFHTMDSLPNFQLLDDIRNLIMPEDISRYDSLMSGMKTEIMTSPGQVSSAGVSRSTTGLCSPSLFSLNDLSFIKPLPSLPLKSAIKSSQTKSQAPTVVDPISYGPVDVVLSPVRVPQQALSWSAADLQNANLTSQWTQPSSSLPLQPLVPMVPLSRPLQNSVPIQGTPYFSLNQMYPGYPAEERMRFTEYAPEIGHAMGPHGQGVWPSGKKSYSIDCLPQSLLYPENHNYGPRERGHADMRRRPSDVYVDSHQKSTIAYDYSDTPAGLARSTSKMSNRRSYLDEEHGQDYNSDNRLQSQRFNHKITPPERPEVPASSRRIRNRSVVETIDESRPLPQSASWQRREDRSRRMSGPVEETSILEVEAPPIGPPISKPRPQSLQVPVDLTAIGPSGDPNNSPSLMETVTVKKAAPFLGLAVEGGSDTNHLLPRIINIQPKGCAHINGELKVGHVIVSINGRKFDELRHAQCVSLISEIFADKEVIAMEFLVKNTVKPVV